VAVSPRSAHEWREFWQTTGERELVRELELAWSPLVELPERERAGAAERVATLLGSRAPERALAAELGRIRELLGARAEPDEDVRAARLVTAWFGQVQAQ
jgi:hypothetical protein